MLVLLLSPSLSPGKVMAMFIIVVMMSAQLHLLHCGALHTRATKPLGILIRTNAHSSIVRNPSDVV